MNAASTPSVSTSAQAWITGSGLSPAAQRAEAARLRQLGFKQAAAENLTTPGNSNRYGLSSVEEFSSHKSAEAELVNRTGPHSQGAPWSYFRVTQIPGARGFQAQGGTQGGRNIAFVDGPYYYVVGVGWQGMANAVPVPKLIAAAIILYHHVHTLAGG